MKKFLKENLGFIIAILLIIIVRILIVTPVRVNGDSMYNTLVEGDVMILNKISNFDRESIVVISKNVAGSRIIKRIIALPGETIKCENGIIYINGEKYDDKYAYTKTDDFDEVILLDDEYFVLGDNRVVSLDSRTFGKIKKEDILGISSLRLYPFNKIGNVE